MKPGVAVRVEAARSLDRIVHSGAYSNVVVHQTDLVGSDRSSHQSMVFAALRWLLPIDSRIANASDRPLDKLQPIVLSVLRIAATESIVLGGEPHAVVDSAVESVGELGAGKAKGLVNAVSRSIANSTQPQPDAADAFPRWMVDRLGEVYDDGRAMLASLNEAVPVGVRLRGAPIDGIIPVRGIDAAGYVTGAVDVRQLEREGLIDVIDPASTAVVQALGIEPGMCVADLAAAPGGKTRAISDKVAATGDRGPGFVVACDVHRSRVLSAAKRTRDLHSIHWLRADALDPPLRAGSFDRVLLDAPCTGLGSLRRRPEIRYRIDERAPAEYGMKQRAMVERALELVRPGGRLVYSVCTVFPEETTEVVAGLAANPPDGIRGRQVGNGILLNPLDSGTDGMFIAVIDR